MATSPELKRLQSKLEVDERKLEDARIGVEGVRFSIRLLDNKIKRLRKGEEEETYEYRYSNQRFQKVNEGLRILALKRLENAKRDVREALGKFKETTRAIEREFHALRTNQGTTRRNGEPSQTKDRVLVQQRNERNRPMLPGSSSTTLGGSDRKLTKSSNQSNAESIRRQSAGSSLVAGKRKADVNEDGDKAKRRKGNNCKRLEMSKRCPGATKENSKTPAVSQANRKDSPQSET